MTSHAPRTAIVAIAAVASIALAATSIAASPARSGPRAPFRMRLDGDSDIRAAGLRDPALAGTAAGVAVPAPETTADIVTVDDRAWAGAENAIYAPDRRTVYIAYKRFLRDPHDPGGDIVPAELWLAKSENGGRTWATRLLDDDSPEEGDLVQQTVSIDGAGDTVYVAYFSDPTGALADMTLEVVKSADAGGTWSEPRTIATGGGEFKAIDVIDARHALIAASGGIGAGATLALMSTSDGGAHWSSRTVDTGTDWYVGLDTASSGRVWITFYRAGPTDLRLATSGSSGPFVRRRVAGGPGDRFFTGLWNSLDVWKGVIYVAFEDFQPSKGKSVVRVLRSTDGGETWKRTVVDSSFAIGWVTSIEATTNRAAGTTDLFVTYWHEWVGPWSFEGHVRIAHSADGGESWSVWTVPEDGSVSPYLDLAVPRPTTQFVSYVAKDPASGLEVLRVARLRLGG